MVVQCDLLYKLMSRDILVLSQNYQKAATPLRMRGCCHTFSEAGSSVCHEVVSDEGRHPEGWEGLQGHQYIINSA